MTLDLPEKIGLIGDIHGKEQALSSAIIALADAGAELLVQLGDFGMILENTASEWKALHHIDELLQLVGLELIVVPGNHDAYPVIAELPLVNGMHRALVNISYAPRGMRAATAEGTRYLFLSGAGSIDRYWRQAKGTWFAGEEITPDDIARIVADGPTDVILGHDAPTTTELTWLLSDTAHYWHEAGLEWCQKMQGRYDEIHRSTRPRLTASGHYHLNVDSTQRFDGPRGEFVSRSVILTREHARGSIRLLHTDALHVEAVLPIDAAARLEQFREDIRALSAKESEVAELLDVDRKTLRRIRNGDIGLPTYLLNQASALAAVGSHDADG